MQLAPTWRSRRDLNPRAGIPTYTLSRGAPSAKLGYFSTCRNCYSLRWRRERDSNPRCLSASLVFRTSSINHSDISPYEPEMPIYYSRASFACQGQTVALPQYAACLLRHVRGIGMDCGGGFCPSPAKRPSYGALPMHHTQRRLAQEIDGDHQKCQPQYDPQLPWR